MSGTAFEAVFSLLISEGIAHKPLFQCYVFCLSVSVCFRVGGNKLSLEVLGYGGEGGGWVVGGRGPE